MYPWLLRRNNRDSIRFQVGVALTLGLALWGIGGCGALLSRPEPLPPLLKSVSFPNPPPSDTLVLGPMREITIPDIKKDIPLIDGLLNDPCWKQAAKAKGFVLRRGDVAEIAKNLDPKAAPEDYAALLGVRFNDEGDCLASQQTVASLCYNSAGIYVAFDCADSEIVSRVTQANGPILEQDDCVELVINTHRNVFHIAVNPKGVTYTSRVAASAPDTPLGPDRWHPSITVAAGKGEQSWQCEMAIPFASLEVQAPRDRGYYGLNIGRRNRPPIKRERYEMTEISTWCPAGYDIREPRSEGVMFFHQGPPAQIAFFDPGNPGFDFNRAAIGVRNRVEKETAAKVRLITFDAEGAIIESTSKDLSLPPKEEVIVALNYKVPWEAKSCSLDVALFAGAPEELIGHEEVDLDLPPEVIGLSLDQKEYSRAGATARGMVGLGVGDIRLGRFRIALAVEGAGGKLAEGEIANLESPEVEFTLHFGTLPPGSYTLTAELWEGADSRGKASALFDMKP